MVQSGIQAQPGTAASANANGETGQGFGRVIPGPASDREATWRFRRHNGEWWYWTPQNTWMYHRNDQWQPYEAGAFTRPQAVTAIPRQPFDSRESISGTGPGLDTPATGTAAGSPGVRDTSSGIPDRQYGIGSTRGVDARYNDPSFRRAQNFGGVAE